MIVAYSFVPVSDEGAGQEFATYLSAIVIRAMERLGLVWEVVRIGPERRARKLAAATP